MTGEEKRAQLKEQYKRDLLLRKEFLDKAKDLQRSQKMTKAVTDITSSLDMGDTDVWIEHLNRESAITEAKMEMSMELADDSSDNLLKAQANEAAQQKFSAEMLVKQMKKEMGLLSDEPEIEEPTDLESKASDEDATADQSEQKAPESPKKTLGDF
ncbi:MAG: hypothetical protein NWR72_21445 [Bacteroidia bacterium]|nr:hypothetical protein [Bacteroidia bacterium]